MSADLSAPSNGTGGTGLRWHRVVAWLLLLQCAIYLLLTAARAVHHVWESVAPEQAVLGVTPVALEKAVIIGFAVPMAVLLLGNALLAPFGLATLLKARDSIEPRVLVVHVLNWFLAVVGVHLLYAFGEEFVHY